jgi:hypothetical protein
MDEPINPPTHRGVDLSFDSLKQKLRVCIHFRRAYPGDPSITEYLDLAPPPAEPDNGDDSDRSNTSASKSETADEDKVSITSGLIIGFGQVVLKVQHLVAGGTHIICFVVKSHYNNYLAGSELSMTSTVLNTFLRCLRIYNSTAQ